MVNIMINKAPFQFDTTRSDLQYGTCLHPDVTKSRDQNLYWIHFHLILPCFLDEIMPYLNTVVQPLMVYIIYWDRCVVYGCRHIFKTLMLYLQNWLHTVKLCQCWGLRENSQRRNENYWMTSKQCSLSRLNDTELKSVELSMMRSWLQLLIRKWSYRQHFNIGCVTERELVGWRWLKFCYNWWWLAHHWILHCKESLLNSISLVCLQLKDRQKPWMMKYFCSSYLGKWVANHHHHTVNFSCFSFAVQSIVALIVLLFYILWFVSFNQCCTGSIWRSWECLVSCASQEAFCEYAVSCSVFYGSICIVSFKYRNGE